MIIQPHCEEAASQLAQLNELFYLDQALAGKPFNLKYEAQGLTLYKADEPKLGGISVDFIGGAMAHRRKFGGGKGQAIAKAVGMNKGRVPSVLDGTAGLGRDGFVLASLGCKVYLHERNPIVAALLYDGLTRGYGDPEIGSWLKQRMQFVFTDSIRGLTNSEFSPEVVYLDPMFPHRKNSALVKKEMRVFQTLVGEDLDADSLLEPALQLAQKRVVVKRPDYAPFLADKKPHSQITTKKNRFDLYVL